MANYKLVTPEGTKDHLFNEVTLRNKITDKFRNLFLNHSYHEVVTPGLEYLDVFLAKGHGLPVEDLYKLVDNHGRLMVLRPDSTTPIARLCATRLKEEKLPLRLFYNQSIYSLTEQNRGHSNEVRQVGVELIGDASKRADLEVLYLAIQALEKLAPYKFRIEIGHIGIYNSLIAQLDLDEETQEEIRSCIESKNYPALNERLDRLGAGPEIEVIKRLPRLFGEEVFDEALALIKDKKTVDIMEYLKKIYTSLKQLNTAGTVTVDFGIVNKKDYYTGIVFKAYLEDFAGEDVLSGGRYDNLHNRFGKDAEAVGFSINVDVATRVLLDRNREKSGADILLLPEKGYEIKAFHYMKELAAKYVVEQSLFKTTEESLAYAKERKIPFLKLVGSEIKTIEVE